MGILDYFTPEARRGNREWLDSQNAAISEALRYYLGPTGIPDRLGLLAESTPTAGLERAGTESSRMFAPGLSGWDRMAAAGNMLSETAGAGAGLLGMPAAGRMADDLVEAAAPTVRQFGVGDEGGLKLYHGSPHDFDKFSMDKIGTGEGAGAAGRNVFDYDPTMVAMGVPGASRSVDDIENVLRTKYPDVKISVSGSPERGFTLNRIDVPKGKREGGIGTAVMSDLVNLVDQQGAVLKLSPSGDFGGSVPRLKDFYARFGFVQNKGKNADYAISESMYRPPSVLPAPTSTDAATQQGSEIINLLRSGRAGEVTEQMLDMGDPVLNARLSEYLYSNYDLPMDTASRMGRRESMGATEQFYKGMFPYDPETMPIKNYKGVVIEGADRIPQEITTIDRPSLFPTFNREDPSEAGYKIAGVMGRDPNIANNFAAWGDSAVYPLDVNLGRTYTMDAAGDRAGVTHFYESGRPFRDAMRSGEYDSGLIKNTSDEGDIAFALLPENIRSRFARFDPRLSHLRNLNAGLATGVPLGLLAMQPDQGPQ